MPTCSRYLSCALLIASVFVTASCSRHDALSEAYRNLYLTMFGLEFPATRDALNVCERNKIQSCLAVVDRARMGKDVLLAMEPRVALRRTLDTIATTCPKKDPEEEQVCVGASVALYFFRDPELDALILKSVMSADRVTQRKLLGPVPFAWHGNRPRPERWIEALGTLPPDAFPDTGRDVVLKGFTSPADVFSDGGVALL